MRADEPARFWVVTPTRVSGPTDAVRPDDEFGVVVVTADAEPAVTLIVPTIVSRSVRSRHNAL